MTDEQKLLERFMWLSIAASVATIVFKLGAAWITGSVGFLSDAIESLINVVAAVVGLLALRLAAKPADANHNFGHAKAEYFSAQVEGSLILVAAVAIIYSAIQRLLDPQPIEQAGVGLVLSGIATVLNLAVGLVLLRAGKKYRSATLSADGQHLLTDVWTTVGVLVGIALVAVTGWQVLDPIIALAVGANILFTGYKLLKESFISLLSEALPEEERLAIKAFLDEFSAQRGVEFTDVRTAAFGRQRMVNLVMQVPGQWSVNFSHRHADDVEDGIDRALGGAKTVVHVEPLGTQSEVGFDWL